MARRFTDRDKWDDEWYLSLTNDWRTVWEYMLDRCTIAGRLKKNLRMLNFCCHMETTEAELLDVFQGRVLDYDTYYFIPKYVKHQYPKGLESGKPMVVSVRRELAEHGLLDIVAKLYGSKGESFNNGSTMVSEPLSNDIGKGNVKGNVKGNIKEKPKPAPAPVYLTKDEAKRAAAEYPETDELAKAMDAWAVHKNILPHAISGRDRNHIAEAVQDYGLAEFERQLHIDPGEKMAGHLKVALAARLRDERQFQCDDESEEDFIARLEAEGRAQVQEA